MKINEGTCIVVDCDNHRKVKQMCHKHYWRTRTYGDPLVVRYGHVSPGTHQTCTAQGCREKPHAKGLCNRHYKRLVIHDDTQFMALERHGLVDTPEYEAWHSMKQRCFNQNNGAYRNYGGRGVRVCAEWVNSFTAFYASMGPRPTSEHSIDRINNDGNYEPGNCRWVSTTVQGNNRRTNVNYTIDGITKSLSEWCAGSEVPYQTVWRRVRDGKWPIKKALLTPVRGSK